MISAILLAAGESKRMGQLKQLMPFGGSTMVEQAVDNLLSSTVDEVIVVVGYMADEVIKTLAARPVKLAVNPDYKGGMLTSIVAGLKLVHSQTNAVMIALGDQPLINSRTIDTLIAEFRQHHKGIAIPTYHGKRGHPTIFASRYIEKLLELKGDIGARQIIKEHPDDVLEIAVSAESIIIDIDTISDYRSHAG